MDFIGKVLKTRTNHEYDNHQEVVTLDTFEYDHMDRLKRQYQCIGDDTLQDNCASSLSSNLTISDPIVTGNHTSTNTITINGATTIEAGAYIFITDSNNAGNSEMIVENTYDDLGQLEKKEVGNTQGNSLQTVDYAYNVRGWLKTINQDNNTTDNDLFNFSISYNSGSNALYNGNISKTEWNSSSSNPLQNPKSELYNYTYDALNRITSAIDNTSNYNLENVTYDKNGNIKTLKRKGYTNTSATNFGVMDDLIYSYDNGNKLMKVVDKATIDQFGFKDDAVNTAADTTNDYSYDLNGNMLTDTNKGITSITYNYLNLPEIVTINGQQIKYTYDASGVKLRKEVQNKITDYAGNYIYEDTELQFFNHAEGYASPDTSLGWKYIYQYKDHLGNVRLSYTDKNQNNNNPVDLEIIEESNYYPFGLKHKGYNDVMNIGAGDHIAQKFKYNGVEYEEAIGLNLYEMDVRMYDPAIARFNGTDPVTHHSQSTSVAFDNNPIFWADPSGADAVTYTGQDAIDLLQSVHDLFGGDDRMYFEEFLPDENKDDFINNDSDSCWPFCNGGIIKISSYTEDSQIRLVRGIKDTSKIIDGEWNLSPYSKEVLRLLRVFLIKKGLNKIKGYEKLKDLFAGSTALTGFADFEIRSRLTNVTQMETYDSFGDVYFSIYDLSTFYVEKSRSETTMSLFKNKDTQVELAIFLSSTGEKLLDISNIPLLDSMSKSVLNKMGSAEQVQIDRK